VLDRAAGPGRLRMVPRDWGLRGRVRPVSLHPAAQGEVPMTGQVLEPCFFCAAPGIHRAHIVPRRYGDDSTDNVIRCCLMHHDLLDNRTGAPLARQIMLRRLAAKDPERVAALRARHPEWGEWKRMDEAPRCCMGVPVEEAAERAWCSFCGRSW